MADDDPVGSMLGSSGVDPRLPPVDRRRGRSEAGGRRRRRSSARTLSPEAAERARRELGAEIDHGNEVLEKAGRRVRLALVPGTDGAPDRVAVTYPPDQAGGARCVVRTVRWRDLAKWLARLERLEGLVVDEER